MARFSVGGDEDGNEERLGNNRPLPKRPRFSNPVVYIHRRTVTASAPSNSGERGTTTTAAEAPRAEVPDAPAAAQEESEDRSSDESGTSWSHSSSESEEESEEEVPEQSEQQHQRSSDEVQPTVARVDPTPENGASRESEGPTGVSVTLSDPDVLDCPICYEPLCLPVYQCENGHVACASCCTTIKNKCASCSWPIGYSRCRAMEKVLESIRITCSNMPYGCKERITYNKKLAHEKMCDYAPCSCPYIGCDYVAISKCLYTHFNQQHPSKRFSFSTTISISLDSTQKHVFLQENSQSTLFVLNRSVETAGSYVNVVCVAPTSEKRAFMYELTATDGESSAKVRTFADFTTKWTAQSPKKMCLLIPSDFSSVRGLLKLELNIWRTTLASAN